MAHIPNILSIAGSDPSGAAGIQADLKAISANGGYGVAALTALTAQNSRTVSGIHMVPPAFVSAQIKSVLTDIQVNAVKIGMLGESSVIEAVVESISTLNCPIVLDPVMISTEGNRLLAREAVSTLREKLLPLATIVTPNLPEAAALLNTAEAIDRAQMEEQARAILKLGAEAVLLKGGHLPGTESPDLLITEHGIQWFEAIRIETKNNRGTGCTLSSALATQLALTGNMETSISVSKAYVQQGLRGSTGLSVGRGNGPVDHFWMLR